MPEEILFGLPNVNTLRQILSSYLKDLIRKLRVAFIAARDNLRTSYIIGQFGQADDQL